MANLMVRWHPKSTAPHPVCAHYDTLPFPLRDQENRRGTFVGANDNASGVAVLMELARDMPDAEEQVRRRFRALRRRGVHLQRTGPRSSWARSFSPASTPRSKPGGRIAIAGACCWTWSGDADLHIYQERNSAVVERHPAAGRRNLGHGGPAGRAGVRRRERSTRSGRPHRSAQHRPHPLHRRDRLSIIPPGTPKATRPDKCSPLSLAKVGWVMREWLKTAK